MLPTRAKHDREGVFEKFAVGGIEARLRGHNGSSQPSEWSNLVVALSKLTSLDPSIYKK